jgi:hypothetical protein
MKTRIYVPKSWRSGVQDLLTPTVRPYQMFVDEPLVGSHNATEEELTTYLSKGWQLTKELRSGKMLIARSA